jgi:acyl-coenzyme A thioesterase PaaI-like protein
MNDFDWENNYCIICGTKNPVGLGVQFVLSESGSTVQVTMGTSWQGFEGIVQGGIITGLLDDAMWYAIYGGHQVSTVTAEITVRFLLPVKILVPSIVEGHVVQYRRRLQVAEATLIQAGQVCATAKGRFVPKPESSE